MKKIILWWFDAITLPRHRDLTRRLIAEAEAKAYQKAIEEIKGAQIAALYENELEKHKMRTINVVSNYNLSTSEVAEIIANSKVVKRAVKDAQIDNKNDISFTIQLAIESKIVKQIAVIPAAY